MLSPVPWGAVMRCRKFLGVLVRAAALPVAIVAVQFLSSAAGAQSAHLKAHFDHLFDCERPFALRDHPMKSEFTATLNADKTAKAELTIKGVIFTSKVYFEAVLGRQSQPAPGGTSQLRVVSKNRLQAIWDLPNNRLILDIAATGRSCRANLSVRLKPGHKDYSFYDGKLMYYCSRHRAVSASCTAN